MEISLPDEAGRLQIFRIHTTKMRNENFVAPDVNLEELAAQTKNYTGYYSFSFFFLIFLYFELFCFDNFFSSRC